MVSPTIAGIDLFDPMDPAVLKRPWAAYRALRDRRPVAYLEPLDLWVVSRYADVREVLHAPEAFSAARAFGRDAVVTDARDGGARRLHLRFSGEAGGVISSSDGAVHERLRRMVARLLSRTRVDEVDRAVHEHVRRLVAGLAGNPEVDLVTDLAGPVAAAAIGAVLGLPERTVAALTAWVDLTARALDPGDDLATAAAAQTVVRGNLVAARAVTAYLNAAPAGSNGVADLWREATGAPDRRAAREEAILSVLQLFQAGYETIVAAVGWALDAFVVDRPDRPLRDPAAVSGLLDEALRLSSPVRATFRTAVGAQRVAGVQLPAGAAVMVLIGSANRDERVFADPDTALPDRSVPHLAFGAGPHRCLGRMLAQVELKHIVGVFDAATAAVTAAGDASISANILKAGYDRLPVAIDWRHEGIR
jgi:cytochrome P450